MLPLSVTVITRNESARIAEALDSVRWAEDLVVVDAHSTDDTVAIARRFTDRVFVHEWEGYAAQKNYAANLARFDWILSLDADERVTPELAQEIRTCLDADGQAYAPSAPSSPLAGLRPAIEGHGAPASECPEAGTPDPAAETKPPGRPGPAVRPGGYRIPRASYYLGRWLRSTDWYPDYQVRLYDRQRGRWTGRYVHESVAVEGRVGRLRGELLHYPYRNMSDHVQTIDRYTGLAARELFEAGRRASLLDIAVRPPLAFLRNYVLRHGFTDGGPGFVVSLLNSGYVLLKFAKLWDMQRTERQRLS